MQDYRGESISALTEDEMIGEDDKYDELYGDVNIGESFQFQLSEAPSPSANDAANEVIDDADDEYEELYGDINIEEGFFHLQMSKAPGLSANGAVSTGIDPLDILGKVGNEFVPLLNPNTSVQCVVPRMPPNPSNDNVNVNRQITEDKPSRRNEESGATMLFVGELHWWTTDAEIESVSSKYGTVKDIKFFSEKATGKSKGYCRVEFYDSAAAAACKKGMNGYNINGRACTVEFSSSHTLWKMDDSYMNKSRVQPQSQPEKKGKRPINNNAETGGGENCLDLERGGNGGNGHVRGTVLSSNSMHPQGRSGHMRDTVLPSGHMRGTVLPSNSMHPHGGSEHMMDTVLSSNFMHPQRGSGHTRGILFPSNFMHPHGESGHTRGTVLPSNFLHPQGMRGAGFDSTYMGRRSGYEDFGGPNFSRMMPPFPNDNAMGIPRVSPHVNPSNFGKRMSAGGMGMMGNAGMDGPHSAMWNDTNMGKCGTEEHDKRPSKLSYGGKEGGSWYGYEESSNDKFSKSYVVSCEKERAFERDWLDKSNKRHRERDHGRERYVRERYERERYNRERYDRDLRYREERDDYHIHRRDFDYKDDWDRGQASSRYRSRSHVMKVDHRRSCLRDAGFGKRSAYRR